MKHYTMLPRSDAEWSALMKIMVVEERQRCANLAADMLLTTEMDESSGVVVVRMRQPMNPARISDLLAKMRSPEHDWELVSTDSAYLDAREERNISITTGTNFRY